MHILLSHIFAWPEVRRGGERYLHELGAALQKAGHQVTILSTAPTPSVGRVLGCEVRYLPRRRFPGRRGHLSYELRFGWQALRLALSMKIDVWHALGRGDAAAAAVHARLRGSRSVFTALGIPRAPADCTPTDVAIQRFLVRAVQEYLVLSPAAGHSLEQGWGRPGRVLGGGVDLDRFRPGPRSPHPVILYSGSLNVPRKNVRPLIEAMAWVAQKRPDVELWLSGPGEAEPLLTDLPAELRQRVVHLGTGTAEDINALYAQAWVTALPSVEEAFGLALIESLACGTPVVALADGGPGSIVTPAVGALAESAEAQALAQACLQALEMAQTAELTQRCRQEAERYSWDGAIVPRLQALYSQGQGSADSG